MKHFLILILLVSSSCYAQQTITKVESPTIKATDKTASLRAGENYWHKVWTISPDINPDIWYVMPMPNKSIKAAFITDVDSISFDVKQNEVYDFKVILNEKEIAHTQIKGVGAKAHFNTDYQLKNRDKTIIEIPEIYELINIIFALTSLASEENSHVVRTDVPYYDKVIEWFKPFENHKCVTTIDSILRKQFNMYFGMKMDTYIYEFNGQKIVSKGIYNRIAQDIGENVIAPELIEQLEDFSKVSNFNKFYESQQAFYNSQINYYKKDINIARMQSWLNREFPQTSYDCFKVIFSPLVDWNQSAAWFDNDGFKEAQAHVNFPYPSEKSKKRTDEENKVLDGNILFTEFNHAFINPESEPYHNTPIFQEAFEDISFWTTKESIAAKSYSNSASLFNELMNWSLVSLYLLDNAPKENVDKFIASIEDWQITKRGFKYFRPFNQNLMKLYKNKKEGQTVADLYPEILKWCQAFVIEEKK